MGWVTAYVLAKKYVEQIRKMYDSNLDNIVNNADAVGGYRATDLEKIANKGVAGGYCPLDDNALVPLERIPTIPVTKLDNLILARILTIGHKPPVAKADSGGNAGTFTATYDLGAPIYIEKLEVQYGGTYVQGVDDDLYVYVSLDNTTWTEVLYIDNFLLATGDYITEVTVGGLYRYLKVEVLLSGAESAYAQINEVWGYVPVRK